MPPLLFPVRDDEFVAVLLYHHLFVLLPAEVFNDVLWDRQHIARAVFTSALQFADMLFTYFFACHILLN